MAIPTILAEIIEWKRCEVERARNAVALESLRSAAKQAPPARDLARSLRRPGISLIAEVKRASPSKGQLRPDLDAVSLARDYEYHGASAISVLTDEHFFQGSLDDLRAVRQETSLPVLRKDFVIDAYQVYEARAAGADAILLIVAVLDDAELGALYQLSSELGMGSLVEVHDQAELERAMKIKPDILGINNRNLHTFDVDLETTARLVALVPRGTALVAESGIHTRTDVDRLAAMGADAILVGESLVRAEDTGKKIQELIA